jgi:hypothetical protein
VKDITFTDKKFNGKPVKTVPEDLEKTGREGEMVNFDIGVGSQGGNFFGKGLAEGGKEQFVGIGFVDLEKTADEIEGVVAHTGAVGNGRNVDADDHLIVDFNK